MAYKSLSYQDEGALALISLNRPPVNALSSETIAEIDAAIEQVRADPKKKALIINSLLDGVFIAGADIKEIERIKNGAEAKELVRKGKAFLDKIEDLEIPVIAAIHGFCLGGGLELALACHFRIAAENAVFGQPEINLGIIPGFGGTQRLARTIGRGRALEMILTGNNVMARAAEQWGLVNRVVPEDDLLREARSLAGMLMRKGKIALAAGLRATVGGLKADFAAGMELETEQFGRVADTEDMREGTRAFLEKRQPQFKDR
ncbi:MAG: enoyl-CoA hydratase-related protein [Candidatus Acetothermia bacterium]|jgi:enoyl-CoA hydratase/carnithine racemase|nr:enoyl-CoA hydratase-related protein [Candidatus Acetothermia bacterium]MDH7504709.1 enoyl-CoA hydratase-related protein [Candidatus Acetothermia bacterium]